MMGHNKLEVWELLRDNPDKWFKASDLRRQFQIKQQITLTKWMEEPFITVLSVGRGTSYKFNKDREVYYQASVAEIVRTPEPKEMKIGNKVVSVPAEIVDDRFTIKFPFPVSDLYRIAESELDKLSRLGPEFDWAKQAIISLDADKYNPKNRAVVEVLIVILSAILKYNGVDHSPLIDKLKESMVEESLSLEDVRKAELDDIMSKVKPTGHSSLPDEWFTD